jgi:hypothetical protein
VTSLSQSLLAKKIDLESQWNKSYLEQGKLTTDMQWLEVELKEVKRQILQQDLEAAKQENNLVLLAKLVILFGIKVRETEAIPCSFQKIKLYFNNYTLTSDVDAYSR